MLSASLDHACARAAIAVANRAPSVYNSQPWRWRLGEASIHLFVDAERALPATDPDRRDLRISCGAALHHLRVALLAVGMRASVHRLPDPARPEHLAAVEISSAQPSARDIALATAIETRVSDRRLFSSRPVPAGLLAELAAAAAANGADLHVLQLGWQRRAVVRLVEEAAIEQALTPGYAHETATWTGRSRSALDGVSVTSVPRLPDGTVPMRHFAHRQEAEKGRQLEDADGTVLALLATKGDGPEDQLRAGEALSAVLLTATRRRLATDPISQPLEVLGTRLRLRALSLGESSEPQLLIRVGWPRPGAGPLPATRRRPVDDTIDEWDAPWE
jgi:hypothetical protein